MTPAAFLEWDLRQDLRHELVDGEPRAMTGARVSHDRVVGNVTFSLRASMRANSNPCDVFGPDIAVITPSGNVRRPDVAVHCPPFDERATSLDHPRLIVEVLSDSTQSVDQFVKLDEYQTITALDYILYIVPTMREVAFWSRTVDGTWTHVVHRAADASLVMPKLGVSLPFAAIYERVPLSEPTGPRLVWPDQPEPI